MLNWAARYYPILKVLRQDGARVGNLLEIGSGSVGIGKFYRAPFVGCDLTFLFPPRAPMLPVVATATNLPFGDKSFEAVIVSDVLEHVPPEQRGAVIREALRVARRVAVFAFPCGPEAFKYDQKLAETYDREQQDRPVWLQEHMQHPFPTEQLFEDLHRQWKITTFGNENLDVHYWIMRKEMHQLWNYVFAVLLAALPGIVEYILRRTDREPYYRRIVVVRRPLATAQSCEI
jgi:Methyltransferase domain